MSRTLRNTSPYILLVTEARKKDNYKVFVAKCKTCLQRNEDRYGMPQCPIFDTFTRSIVDRTLRWEEEWVEKVDGYWICKCYKHQGEKTKKGKK